MARALEAAQKRQKTAADRHRRDLHFTIGAKVLLSTKNLTLKGHPSPKFKPRWVGPFSIMKRVGAVAYQLALPPTMKIHPVFHVSLLKNYRGEPPFQPPVIIEGEERYEVERII